MRLLQSFNLLLNKLQSYLAEYKQYKAGKVK
jgi:hypothetical protein